MGGSPESRLSGKLNAVDKRYFFRAPDLCSGLCACPLMMKNKIIKRCLFGLSFLLTAVLYTSCVKEEISIDKIEDSFDINTELALPVGYFDFRIENLIRKDFNSEISVNRDSLLTMNYIAQSGSAPAGEIFKLESVDEQLILLNTSAHAVDLSMKPYRIDTVFHLPVRFVEIGDPARLDSIILNEATLTFTGILATEKFFSAKIVIPGLRQNGVAFETVVSETSANLSFDLTGYTIIAEERNDGSNHLTVYTDIIFSIQNDDIQPDEQLLAYDIWLDIYSWELIYGNLVQEIIDLGTNSLFTNLEASFQAGQFYFREPELRFHTQNSFSFPTAMSINPILAQSVSAGDLLLSGKGIPSPPDFFYPAYPRIEGTYSSVTDSVILNTENTNLRDFISTNPYRIQYSSLLVINPESLQNQSVISRDSKFSTQVELYLPFYGKARDLGINSLMSFNLADFNTTEDENISGVLFKLYYKNSYPADIDLQLYIADQNLQVTDTVFVSPQKIQGVLPEDHYTPDPPFRSGELQAWFEEKDIDNLRNAKYIIGESVLNTVSLDDVKIFSNQNLNLNLGVVIDYQEKN